MINPDQVILYEDDFDDAEECYVVRAVVDDREIDLGRVIRRDNQWSARDSVGLNKKDDLRTYVDGIVHLVEAYNVMNP